MNKFTKIILIASCSAIILGILLICTGRLIGGSDVFNSSFNINGSGSNSVSYTDEDIKTGEVAISEFDELIFSASSIDLIVENGADYKLEYSVPEALIPIVDQDGQKLSITQPHTSGFNFSFNLSTPKGMYYKLTVPETTDCSGTISTSSGDIRVTEARISGTFTTSSGDITITDLNMPQNTLTLNTSSGDCYINNTIAGTITRGTSSGSTTCTDSEADIAKFSSSSGDCNINSCRYTTFSSTTSSGSIEADDFSVDAISASSSSGDIELKLVGKEKEYGMEIKSTSGDIEINENEYEKSYAKDKDNSDKLIIVETTSGDVDIDFK